MSIIDKIRQSVTAATGLQCYYQTDGNLNRILDNVALPCAFLYLLREGEYDTQDGQHLERVRVGVFFTNKTEFDFGSIENEQIIQGCKADADKWLESLRGVDSTLQVIGSVTTRRVYDAMDVILTAFGVNVELQEIYGYNPCHDKL